MSTKHIGHQVVEMMDRVGVSPITRNYHLFYVCIANSNPLLRRAVRNLGKYPTQGQLDQVIDEYCPETVDSTMARRHEHALLGAIDDLATLLQSEKSQMTGFNNAIERVSTALSKSAEQDQMTTELLMKVVRAIGEAGDRRVSSGQRTIRRMEESRSEVDTLRDELIRVRRMANTDVLTGLANRRHFDDKLAAAFGMDQGFALVLADIDHFKVINDTYGHSFGDHVLKLVATTMAKTSRAGTLIARTGGEEFGILLSNTDQAQAIAVAERVRVGVETIIAQIGQENVMFSISLGVAMSKSADTCAQLYEYADIAMYRSKELGRNLVTVYEASSAADTSERYRIYAR